MLMSMNVYAEHCLTQKRLITRIIFVYINSTEILGLGANRTFREMWFFSCFDNNSNVVKEKEINSSNFRNSNIDLIIHSENRSDSAHLIMSPYRSAATVVIIEVFSFLTPHTWSNVHIQRAEMWHFHQKQRYTQK